METHENYAPAREWLTVDQAFLACQEAGLDRTKKTIRSWCRHEHVESLKQTTPTGERWMVEKSSLAVKIRSELEFQQYQAEVRTSSNPSEPVQTKDEPVRTRADEYEQGRTGSNHGEPNGSGRDNDPELEELRSQVRSLEIDKAVRDKQIEYLTKENEKGKDNLLSQSRYIGHLETKVHQLGDRPDQQFLNAPIPGQEAETNIVEPDVVNDPRQQRFDVH
jgi:hypothetical protein